MPGRGRPDTGRGGLRMLPSQTAALFFLVLGILLIVGPALLFYLDRRHTLDRMDVEEFIDDGARKRGTLLFIAGGVSFVVMGVLFFILGK